jgi:hypothetical protein
VPLKKSTNVAKIEIMLKPTPGGCAEKLLSEQPDFKDQKTILQYEVEKEGHIFTLYPKYHCETNWIEMHWGYSKSIARLNCDYSYKSLEENIDKYLDYNGKKNGNSVNRRFFNRCYRVIHFYSEGKDVYDVNEEMKKHRKTYKSKRKIALPSFTEDSAEAQ